MNKPVKLLAGVAVLAFASMGLYYAWLTPVKQAKSEQATRRPIEVGPKVSSGGTVAPNEEARRIPANSVPSQVPTEPVPAGTTVAGGASVPPGFKPVEPAMQPLPEKLSGFEPVKAPPAVGVAAVPAPTSAASQVPAVGATPAPVPAAATTQQTQAARPAAGSVPSIAPASAPLTPPANPVSQAAVSPAPQAPAAKPAAKAETYVVKEGDTVVGIWSRLTGSERGWEKLLAANPGLEPERLKIGQVLKLPEVGAPSSGKTGTPAAAATTTVQTGGSSASSGTGTYTVAAGDTLSRISSKVYGDSKHWQQIYDANKDAIGPNPASLKVGQVLHIPGKGGAKASGEKHAAGSGESKPAPAPSTAPAPRPASIPAGTIGAPTVNPPSTPAPR